MARLSFLLKGEFPVDPNQAKGGPACAPKWEAVRIRIRSWCAIVEDFSNLMVVQNLFKRKNKHVLSPCQLYNQLLCSSYALTKRWHWLVYHQSGLKLEFPGGAMG